MERLDRHVGKVSTVLRGDNLREVVHAKPTTDAPGPVEGKLVNGVPQSAAKYCCGRACQHCRIYWHRTGA